MIMGRMFQARGRFDHYALNEVSYPNKKDIPIEYKEAVDSTPRFPHLPPFWAPMSWTKRWPDVGC